MDVKENETFESNIETYMKSLQLFSAAQKQGSRLGDNAEDQVIGAGLKMQR